MAPSRRINLNDKIDLPLSSDFSLFYRDLPLLTLKDAKTYLWLLADYNSTTLVPQTDINIQLMQ